MRKTKPLNHFNQDAPPSKNVECLISSYSESLFQVTDKINRNGKGIVFIVDANNQFIGTLTDGDIRRAMLSRCPLETEAKHLLDKESDIFSKILGSFGRTTARKLQKASISAAINTPIDELMELVDERVKIIPLLNEKKNVVDYFEYESSFYAPVASPFMMGNELSYIVECIETNWISSKGRFIEQFEEQFAHFCGAQYGIAVSSGTTALHLALIGLGVGEGDEVILPDLTFAATINAILHARATPVLVDVEADSWCIDPNCIARAITPNTKAIIPVHLYGQPANMTEVCRIAKESGLFLIEDCAEALGAMINGRRVGGLGHVGCFSFFGNKIITTGEGGMCITSDLTLYEKMRCLRDHGMSKHKKYWHEVVGYNYRMTNLQAAIGVAQLEKIDDLLKRRNEIKAFYHRYLRTLPLPLLEKQSLLEGRVPVTWLVSFLLDVDVDRDLLIQKASEKGVDIRPFFYPLSDMPLYQTYCPYYTLIAHDLSRKGINLPTSLGLSNFEYRKIVDILIKLLPDVAYSPTEFKAAGNLATLSL